jgi:putative flippase GtrA
MALGLNDIASNAIGYVIGFGVSFLLNSRWTFEHKSVSASTLGRFLIVTCVAYLGNIGTMLLARDHLHIDHRAAQLFGVVAYTAIGFVGARVFAFRLKKNLI